MEGQTANVMLCCVWGGLTQSSWSSSSSSSDDSESSSWESDSEVAARTLTDKEVEEYSQGLRGGPGQDLWSAENLQVQKQSEIPDRVGWTRERRASEGGGQS